MEIFLHGSTWISLLTLTAMEIVLGIDNVIFIAILAGRLPLALQARARRLGLSLAFIVRLLLLFSLSWMMKLTTPLFSLFSQEFSGRDLILLVGGLFLIAKSTHEIYHKLEIAEEEHDPARKKTGLGSVLLQILVLDIIFSLDSVITAVGMSPHILIMVIAMMASVVVMLLFAGGISNFVNRHPSMKILALSFLLLIGVLLTAEGFGQHVNKGYIYFAMAFSLVVELLNMRFKKNQKPVTLHEKFE